MLLFDGITRMCCSETIPVEYLGGKPLCMNQYYEVLSSCRIPGLKTDSVVNHAKSSRPPKHITVVHNFQVRSTSVRADLGPETCVPKQVQLLAVFNPCDSINRHQQMGHFQHIHWSNLISISQQSLKNLETIISPLVRTRVVVS